MTSGTKQIGGDPEVSTHPAGYRFKRTWSGNDGKTFSYAGGKKAKWNYYSATISISSIGVEKWKGRFWDNYPTTTPKHTIAVGPSSAATALGGPDASFSSNDQLRLLNKLADKVKGHNFNLAVNVAQGNQVVSMVTSNLVKLAKSMRALKHGDFATAARQLGARPRTSQLKTTDVSGRWLELQYGWLPMLGDTYEAAKAYEAITSGPRSKMYVASIAAVAKEQKVLTGPLSYSYKNKVKRRIIFDQYEAMSAKRQLGLEDPYSVIWEIIPYSFVVDWFVPIGSYLDAMNAIPALNGRFLTTTTTTREGMFIEDAGIEQYSLSTIPSRDAKLITVLRQPSTAINPPLPSFSQGLSGKRIWNAIALAHQAFS
jgi:hypothetical protein